MDVYICEDCGLQFPRFIVNKKICPRCDCKNLSATIVPEDEWSFVDEALGDKWAEVAKHKGLAD